MLLLLLLLILLRLSFLEFAVGLFVYQKEAKKKIANKYMETFANRIHIRFQAIYAWKAYYTPIAYYNFWFW